MNVYDPSETWNQKVEDDLEAADDLEALQRLKIYLGGGPEVDCQTLERTDSASSTGRKGVTGHRSPASASRPTGRKGVGVGGSA
nr:hypothetical protein Iba_scaffold1675372CG0010 [Ipomoea batatas]